MVKLNVNLIDTSDSESSGEESIIGTSRHSTPIIISEKLKPVSLIVYEKIFQEKLHSDMIQKS